MYTRLVIFLADDERKALQTMGEMEMRGLKDQARYILRTELERRGLLAAQATLDPPVLEVQGVNDAH